MTSDDDELVEAAAAPAPPPPPASADSAATKTSPRPRPPGAIHTAYSRADTPVSSTANRPQLRRLCCERSNTAASSPASGGGGDDDGCCCCCAACRPTPCLCLHCFGADAAAAACRGAGRAACVQCCRRRGCRAGRDSAWSDADGVVINTGSRIVHPGNWVDGWREEGCWSLEIIRSMM